MSDKVDQVNKSQPLDTIGGITIDDSEMTLLDLNEPGVIVVVPKKETSDDTPTTTEHSRRK